MLVSQTFLEKVIREKPHLEKRQKVEVLRGLELKPGNARIAGKSIKICLIIGVRLG
jgi:hypothetical protein